MKKFLKWAGILLGGLMGLGLMGFGGLGAYAKAQFKPVLKDRPLYPITADTSPEGTTRGKYLMEGVTGCFMGCHSEFGERFAGGFEAINEGPISAVFAVPNLTSDMETGLGGWTDAQIARAIREGVDKDGVGLVIMPAYNYHQMSDADVAAAIGYLRSLEPVKNAVPPLEANLIGKIMLVLDSSGVTSVGEPITEPVTAPPAGTTAYGSYLVGLASCRDCHRANLAGGPMTNFSPDAPPSANLTPTGPLASWSTQDFITAIKTGTRPDGTLINSEYMPWPAYSAMTEEDLTLIFQYLQSVPAAEPES